MLILDAIEGHVDSKVLFKVNGFSEPSREVYVTEDVARLISGPFPDELSEQRCAYVAQDIHRFVDGELITACMTPRKAKDALFGLLDPASDGIWDIRSSAPKPSLGLRILGGFAATDIFVGLTWEIRDDLGEYGSPKWEAAIQRCRTRWQNLFVYHRKTGDDIHDFISTKVYLTGNS